jgi:hypothetical protein
MGGKRRLFVGRSALLLMRNSEGFLYSDCSILLSSSFSFCFPSVSMQQLVYQIRQRRCSNNASAQTKGKGEKRRRKGDPRSGRVPYPCPARPGPVRTVVGTLLPHLGTPMAGSMLLFLVSFSFSFFLFEPRFLLGTF